MSLLCADGGTCVSTLGQGECDGGSSITILGFDDPLSPKRLQAESTSDECSQVIDWGGSDAGSDAFVPSLTEDYACPAGTIRVHVRDIWSTLANPTKGTLTTRPMAVLLIETSSWFPIGARVESDGCDWYSVCAPQPMFQQFRLGVTDPNACATVQDTSGVFNLSSYSGASDVWIEYKGTSATLATDYANATLGASAFVVTSNKADVEADLCPAGSPPSGAIEGFTRIHVRYPWSDPAITGYQGTACEDDLAGITSPPYPTTLRLHYDACDTMAMLDLQNSHCPWYTAYIPNSAWDTAAPSISINYPNPGAPLLATSNIELPNPRTEDEYWIAYTGPPDDIAWSGQGVACMNWSTRPDSIHFFSENPGPGYAGCGGDSDVTVDPCNPPSPEGYHNVHFRYIWAGQKIFTFFPALDLMPSWIILELNGTAGGVNITCTREADRPWFVCQVPDQYFAEGVTWRAVDKTNIGVTEWNTVENRPFPTEAKEWWIRWYYGKPDYTTDRSRAIGDFKAFDYYPDGVGGDWSATGVWNDQDCEAKPPTTAVQLGYGGWFPYDETGYVYPFGSSLSITYSAPGVVQPLFNYLVQERYEIWKTNYLVYGAEACGDGTARVRTDPPETVSEGQGYGIAIAAAIGDKDTFVKLWNFTRHYLSQSSKKYCGGLMGWMWQGPESCRPLDKPCDPDTDGCGGNGDSAFDGDVDIAIGLVYAAMQWPEYRQAAVSWLLKMECEIDATDGAWAYPAPGDTYNKTDCSGYEAGNPNSKPCNFPRGANLTVNLGYNPPGYFRVFGDFLYKYLSATYYTETQKSAHRAFWYKAAETIYEMFERCYDNTSVNPGLVTDWGHYSTPCDANTDNYNWARYLWRVGIDAAWFGNRTDIPENVAGSSSHYPGKSRMQAKIDNIQAYFNSFYLANPVEPNANRFSSICQNLAPDGSVTGCDPSLGHNSYFVGTMASAYVSVFDNGGETTGGIRREAVEEAISTAIMNDKYYQESIGVYSLMFLTGNFPNPLAVP